MKPQRLKLLPLAGLLTLGLGLSGCGTGTNAGLPLPPDTFNLIVDFLVIPNANTNQITTRVVDPENGEPLHDQAQPSGGLEPFLAKNHPLNDFVYVANRLGNNLTGLRADRELSQFVPVPGPAAAPTGVRNIVIHPGGNFLYAAGDTEIQAYSVGANGSLTPVGAALAIPQASGFSGAFTAGGTFLHLPLANSIQSFAVDANTGALTATVNTPVAGTVHHIEPTAFDNQLFLAVVDLAGVDTGSVIGFAPNASNEPVVQATTAISVDPVGVSSSNGRLFVGSTDKGISVFNITPSNGSLVAVDGSPFVVAGGGIGPKVSTAGDFVFSTTTSGDTLGVQGVDAEGKLTAVTDSPFLDNLNGARFFDVKGVSFTIQP